MPAFPTTLHPEARTIVVAAFAALLTSCSGGGGGSNTPAPTVQLQAEPSNIISGGTATLTWSSTNADTCAASGGWSGTRPVSGSEDVGPLTTSTTYSLQCNGQGGSDSASATVTILAGTGTVAGQLLVPTISRSDGDVNDPFAPFAPNDTDQEAQIMPNPVVIGGYVNEPNAGPDDGGRSFALGDLDDWYRVDLVAGQVIELVMPSATARTATTPICSSTIRTMELRWCVRGYRPGRAAHGPRGRDVFHRRVRCSQAHPSTA